LHPSTRIHAGKIKTTVHTAKVLSTVNNQYITPQTVRNMLKAAEMIAVSKQKKPLLTRKGQVRVCRKASGVDCG